MKKPWVLSYPSSLGARHFVGFVVRWLRSIAVIHWPFTLTLSCDCQEAQVVWVIWKMHKNFIVKCKAVTNENVHVPLTIYSQLLWKICFRHYSTLCIDVVHPCLLKCERADQYDKTNKMACVPSKDSDQPWHPPSLIRVFADAQADLSFHWVHNSFCWFCHEAAQIYYVGRTDNTWFVNRITTRLWLYTFNEANHRHITLNITVVTS